MSRRMDYQVLAIRQRRNMRAYLKVIHLTKRALEEGNVLRALALVSANHKYPPDLVRDIAGTPSHWICSECGHVMENPNGEE